ncbi:MAG: FkbM family methyltransferase [Acidobacteriota bacterium]
MNKIATAMRVYRSQGFKGVILVYPQKIRRWLFENDHWWAGKLIELKGNTAMLDGCIFDLHSPLISTSVKSQFLLNRYEKNERKLLKLYFNPELPVIELGAAVGVMSCLTNKRLVNPHHHIVVEANADLLPLLEINRLLNGCSFRVIHRAIAYGRKQVLFKQKANFLASSVQAINGNPLSVSTITLKEILDEQQFELCTLICDIEGGERDLINYEIETLKERVKTIILEVHEWSLGKDAVNQTLLKLQRNGFKHLVELGINHVFENEHLLI